MHIHSLLTRLAPRPRPLAPVPDPTVAAILATPGVHVSDYDRHKMARYLATAKAAHPGATRAALRAQVAAMLRAEAARDLVGSERRAHHTWLADVLDSTAR
jgi:hypothetical protein